MALWTKTKMNHTGAKNGGGYWGTRYEAKRASKKGRRVIDKKEVKNND